MPNFGSKKQNTGGAKPGANQPASKNFDQGTLSGFGTDKGARAGTGGKGHKGEFSNKR
jgi:hypothetical protein